MGEFYRDRLVLEPQIPSQKILLEGATLVSLDYLKIFHYKNFPRCAQHAVGTACNLCCIDPTQSYAIDIVLN